MREIDEPHKIGQRTRPRATSRGTGAGRIAEFPAAKLFGLERQQPLEE